MLKFLRDFVKHKYYVFIYGRKLGLGIYQLLIHDLSKLSRKELPGYIDLCNGLVTDKSKSAWEHHKMVNEHHPEHWNEYWDGRYMPLNFVFEMVADWQAAELSYANRYDMSEWLNKNWDKLILNCYSREHAVTALTKLGYVKSTDGWRLK